MDRLDAKVALITGGGSGIGRATALLFAENGADICICGRRPEPLEETAREIRERGRRVLTVRADISQEEDVCRLVEATVGQLGRLDILINNASVIGQIAPVIELNLEEWNRDLAVNLTGAMLCCREAAKHMIERGSGAIVNVSSNIVRKAAPNRASYACSKWALNGLTQDLALEVAEYGIRVNAVCPGPILTERLRRSMMRIARSRGISFEQLHKEWIDQAPLKRFATEEECARLILFLSDDDSSAVTGQAINITGGVVMT